MGDVLIIGAGAAGLAAADVLARENVGVTLLEARERIGGRIFTSTSHVGSLFRTDSKRIAELILGVYHHDWTHDPFAFGAYSYTPAGANEMASQLGTPLQGTLFFAGEATDLRGEQGTVHSALASGQRAAKEMLMALKKARIGAPG